MSYAEAATAGLANKEGEPVESVGVSKQEVRDAVEEMDKQDDSSDNNDSNKLNFDSEEAKKKAKKVYKEASEEAKHLAEEGHEAFDKAVDHLRDDYNKAAKELKDPVVAGHVIINLVAAIGIGAALFQENKRGKMPWWPTGVLFATGAFVLGTVEFFSLHRLYKNRNKDRK
uniref:ARAD1A09482p n=1 Tax=Blastobotrys adeninivorans TaxID=409370 RepID=A0A060T3F8_BLAAD